MREPPREDDAHPDVHASVNPACRKQSQHFSLDSKTPGACHRGVKCDAGQQPDKQPPWTSARWQGRYPGCAACLLACMQAITTHQPGHDLGWLSKAREQPARCRAREPRQQPSSNQEQPNSLLLFSASSCRHTRPTVRAQANHTPSTRNPIR